MSFFSRVLSYVLNETLVNGLSNSRIFQRFAITTNEQLKQMAKKGEGMTKQAVEFSNAFKEEFASQMKESAKK